MAVSASAPPGPIPNPVVTRRSAGEYCGGDSTGGEAVAGAPDPRSVQGSAIGFRSGILRTRVAGWSSGSSLGS